MSTNYTLCVLKTEGQSTFPEERPEHWRFRVLPFAAILPEETKPSSSQIVTVFDAYPSAWIHLLQGIDWLLTQGVDVVSLSWKPKIRIFKRDDPFQIATEFVCRRGIPVIVAAGNNGSKPGTLQVLAQAPWVIAVGATDAEERLLKSSSRGFLNGPHPTVVCNGEPGLQEIAPKAGWNDYGPGTSFAAPKVANIVSWILKCLQLIVGDLADQQREEWSALSRPIRLPVIGVPDTGVEPDCLPPLSEMAAQLLKSGQESVAVSRGSSEFRWYKKLVDMLCSLKLVCQVSVTVETVKHALTLMARPLPGYAPYEVGGGFISHQEVEDYFCSFTPSRFIHLFGSDLVTKISEETLTTMDRQIGALWDRSKVQVLRSLFSGGVRFAVTKVC